MPIECPECGTEISDEALSCPRCGLPMTQSPKSFRLSKRERPLAHGRQEGCFLQTLNCGCAVMALVIGLIILLALGLL